LRNQLDERSIELSDAEARYSMMQRTLLHRLARTENENNEMREQLTGMSDQMTGLILQSLRRDPETTITAESSPLY
jgi:6-phosphogluconolactonase/glucosamine-6-phosphate isomerase/deaminase